MFSRPSLAGTVLGDSIISYGRTIQDLLEKAGLELDPLVDVLMFMFPSSDALEFLEAKYSSMVDPNPFKLSAVQALRDKLVVSQAEDFFRSVGLARTVETTCAFFMPWRGGKAGTKVRTFFFGSS